MATKLLPWVKFTEPQAFAVYNSFHGSAVELSVWSRHHMARWSQRLRNQWQSTRQPRPQMLSRWSRGIFVLCLYKTFYAPTWDQLFLGLCFTKGCQRCLDGAVQCDAVEAQETLGALVRWDLELRSIWQVSPWPSLAPWPQVSFFFSKQALKIRTSLHQDSIETKIPLLKTQA